MVKKLFRYLLRRQLGQLGWGLHLLQEYCGNSKEHCWFTLTYSSVLLNQNYYNQRYGKWCARLEFNYRPPIESWDEDPWRAVVHVLHGAAALLQNEEAVL